LFQNITQFAKRLDPDQMNEFSDGRWKGSKLAHQARKDLFTNPISDVWHKTSFRLPYAQQALLQTATAGAPPSRSNSAGQKQYDDDDKEDSAHANAGMAKTIAIPAEAATKTAKQVNNKDDNKDGSERHNYCSLCVTTATSLARPHVRLSLIVSSIEA
jgi:hypothetical protein